MEEVNTVIIETVKMFELWMILFFVIFMFAGWLAFWFLYYRKALTTRQIEELPLSMFYNARYCFKCKWFEKPAEMRGMEPDKRAVIMCPECGNHHVTYVIGRFSYLQTRTWYGKKVYDIFSFIPKSGKKAKKVKKQKTEKKRG